MAETPATLEEAYQRLDQLNDEVFALRKGRGKAGIDQRIHNHERAIEKLQRVIDEMKAADLEQQIAAERHARLDQALRDPHSALSRSAIPGETGMTNIHSQTKVGTTMSDYGLDRQWKAGNTMRDQTLEMVDDLYRDTFSSDALDHIDRLVRDDEAGLESGYLLAAGQPAYASAFAKLVRAKPNTNAGLTEEEAFAFSEVERMDRLRAMGSGTTAGGYAVPISLDPTVTLTSDGTLNPFRQIADVQTIPGNTWQGVSSDGVSAAFTAEGTEAADGAPTFAQPTCTLRRAQCFVPFSIEIGEDFAALQFELNRMFSDAKDQLEAGEFLTATGTAPHPVGILGVQGLTTAAKVVTAATAAMAIGDVYSLVEALPARYQPNATVLGHPSTFDAIYRLVGGGSTEPPIMVTRDGSVVGRNKAELSTMDTALTTGKQLLLIGDFQAGMAIRDRVGARVEIVPHLLGTARGYPTAMRGAFYYWRTAVAIKSANAFRYLSMK